jgi:hypothetical protein
MKLSAYGKSIPKTNDQALKLSAELVGKTIEAGARQPTGGDLTFSGAKGSGKVGTRWKVNGDQSVEVRAVGPMHWLERGVKPHDIVPGARRGAARGMFGYGFSRGQFGPALGAGAFAASGGLGFAASTRGAGVVLKFADGRFSRYARKAGGFPAKQVWSKGIDASRPPVKGIWRTRHAGALASFF